MLVCYVCPSSCLAHAGSILRHYRIAIHGGTALFESVSSMFLHRRHGQSVIYRRPSQAHIQRQRICLFLFESMLFFHSRTLTCFLKFVAVRKLAEANQVFIKQRCKNSCLGYSRAFCLLHLPNSNRRRVWYAPKCATDV